MKKLFALILVVAMAMSLWVPVSAANQNLELTKGSSETISVPWNESSYSIVNGVDPMQVLVSNTGIISTAKTGTTMTSSGSHIAYKITGREVGTTSLVFKNRNTGVTLASYNVTVKENPNASSSITLCVDQKKSFTIEAEDVVNVKCDGEYTQHSRSYRGSSVMGMSQYETTYKLSFPKAGTVNLQFTLGSYVVEQYTITVKEHEFGTEPTKTTEATCKEKATATYKCKNCGEEKTVTVGELAEHKWNTEPTVDKQATCTEKGSQSIHCSVCNEIKEGSVVEIPEKPHTYGEPQYTWEKTSDGYKVIAEWVCSVCKKKETKETDVKESSAVVKDNIKTYTAKFSLDDKEFTATKEEIEKYQISVSKDDNVVVTLSENEAKPGSAVQFIAAPKEGYTLESVQVKDAEGKACELVKKDNGYSFTMPESDVTVITVSKEVPSPAMPKFDDVNDGAWYSPAVAYVVQKGYMTGTGNNRFEPNTSVTRAMVAQILYAMEQKPGFEGKSVFTDVPEKEWYYTAVNWAAKNGLVAGYGNGIFGPNNPVTREQLAAILNKYTQYKKYNSATAGDLSKFKDNAAVSGWAKASMQWAVGNGLISGFEDGRIQPQGTATRAQLATILRAYDTNIRK